MDHGTISKSPISLGAAKFTSCHWSGIFASKRRVAMGGSPRYRATGPNVYKSYRAILNIEQDVSELAPELEARLTHVPVEYESLLQPLAQDLCKSTTNDVEKIRAITDYFRSEYKYSLDGFDVPAGGDP